MACRARKTVLWLVCKDPSRSLLGASRITCRALSCAVRRLGEVRPPIPTPVRLFPAVGRWGSVSTPVRTPSCPQRRRSPTKPSARKKDLDGWVIRRRRLAQAIFFAEKKKGLPGGLHMLFLEYSESDNYSETPWYYFLPQPDATQRTRRTAFLAYLSCFTCLQGYASVCGSSQHTTKKGHPHLHRPSPVRFDLNGRHKLSHVGVFAERPTPTGYL
jgi:hypothetical protein